MEEYGIEIEECLIEFENNYSEILYSRFEINILLKI
jgi:hypothetical protein